MFTSYFFYKLQPMWSIAYTNGAYHIICFPHLQDDQLYISSH